MTRSTFVVLTGAALMLAAGCADSTSPSTLSPMLANAFLSTPAGFSSTDNSFSASGDLGDAWMPDRGDDETGDHLMGGGLRPEFFGGIGMGHRWDDGPFGFGELLGNCTFSATDGRVSCPDGMRRGLTITRSFQFMDASGTVQSAPNSSTNSIDEQLSVSGTMTRHDGAVTSTVQHSSDRTVAGLAPGSSQRTVDGASKGDEHTQGTSPQGSFTAVRTVGDTTTGLVIPLQDGHPTYPAAGRVVRAMEVTVTVEGRSPVTATRKEVITYDGSNSATVVITRNGTTKNCKLPLPFGRLNCS
jgi:hypothetical protein